MTVTRKLKAELWKRFGSKENPSEWDGNVYGGGKLSQRYWEYFKGAELLNLDENSVVLDIGGGSPVTGMGFFSALLGSVIKKVIIIDPNIHEHAVPQANVEFVRRNASYEELKQLFQSRPGITHVSCISVFEHIESEARNGIVRATNEFFDGESFVATLEFHSKVKFFDYQLNTRTTSELFSHFTRFYPDEICASPVLCENAFDQARTFRISRRSIFAALQTPRWYPLAVRFVRVDS